MERHTHKCLIIFPNHVSGGKIEFRILTYTPDEWPDGEEGNELTILSEDESLYFKNMVVSLLVSMGDKFLDIDSFDLDKGGEVYLT